MMGRSRRVPCTVLLALACGALFGWTSGARAETPGEGDDREKWKVTLDVNATDKEDDPLTYEWQQTDGPKVQIHNARTPHAHFFPTKPGRYVFVIRVSDGKDTSMAQVVRDVKPTNRKPFADPGANEKYTLDQLIVVNGGNSTDADGKIAAYKWTLLSGPKDGKLQDETGKELAAKELTDRVFRFKPLKAGEYIFELLVQDDKGEWSEPKQVKISVAAVNVAPQIVQLEEIKVVEIPYKDIDDGHVMPPPAGDPPVLPRFTKTRRMAKMGEDLVLDGTGATDPMGEPLTYLWRQSDKDPVKIRTFYCEKVKAGDDFRKAFSQPVWIARPEEPGTYTFELIVTAGKGKNQREAVSRPLIFDVVGGNRSPVAVLTVLTPKGEVGKPVKLDGSKSKDADEDKLEFKWGWSREHQNPGKYWVTDGNPAEMQFIPEKPGKFGILLVVSDGKGGEHQETAVVEVEEGNKSPVFDELKRSVECFTGQEVRIVAKVSDPNQDPVAVEWKVQSPPDFKLPEAVLKSNPLVFTPEKAQVYTFKAIASDRSSSTESELVQVAVTEAKNSPPTAVLDGPQKGTVGERVTFSGAKSYDPEHKPLTFVWRQVRLPGEENTPPIPGPVPGEKESEWSFTPVEPGEYRVGLIVSDGLNTNTNKDQSLVVSVAPAPKKPEVADPESNLTQAAKTAIEQAPETPKGPEKPEVVEKPESAEKPEVVEKPESAEKPEVVEKPEPAEKPEVVEKPEPAEKPEVVEKPEPAVKTDSVEPEPASKPEGVPVAGGRAPRNAKVGETITVDGSESSDSAGSQKLRFFWSIDDREAAEPVGGIDGPKLKLKLKRQGALRVQLIVKEGDKASLPFVFEIDVEKAASALVLGEVKGPRKAQTGEEVVLEAPEIEGRKVNYAWVQARDGAPDLKLSDEDLHGRTLRFTATEPGSYVFLVLAADENKAESAPVKVTVEVSQGKEAVEPPEARLELKDRGPFGAGTDVVLDASRSIDPKHGELSYHWRQVEGPELALGEEHGPNLTVKPEKAGTYVVEVRADNGSAKSKPVQVRFEVLDAPQAVIADIEAGPAGEEILLDGSGSKGNRLRYEWSVVSTPPEAKVKFPWRGTGKQSVKVKLPSDGEYVFQLKVRDDRDVWSAPATATVKTRAANAAPQARALALAGVTEVDLRNGADLLKLFHVVSTNKPLAVEERTLVVLDGSASTDPDNAPQPLTYRWKQLEGDRPEQQAQEGARLRFVPARGGRMVWQLVVSDGRAESEPATATVVVLPAGELPIAMVKEATIRKNAVAGSARCADTVILDASNSFFPANAKDKFFGWKQVSGQDLGLREDALSLQRLGFNVSVPGTYRFVVMVSDGRLTSLPAVVTVLISDPSMPKGHEAEPEVEVKTRNTGEDESSSQAKPPKVGPEGALLPPPTPKVELPPPAPKVEEPKHGTEPEPVSVGNETASTELKQPAEVKAPPPVETTESPEEHAPPRDNRPLSTLSDPKYRADDPVFQRQRSRLEVLARKPGREPEEELIRGLDESDKDLRSIAAMALVQRGMSSVPALIRVLEGGEEKAKKEAHWALMELSREKFPAQSKVWKEWYTNQALKLGE
ncbi:MAG: hypothetical protein L6R28_16960 [Planctomycetes bacterium]|nr:hypothetical protein [Planctomycetota bacterium]